MYYTVSGTHGGWVAVICGTICRSRELFLLLLPLLRVILLLALVLLLLRTTTVDTTTVWEDGRP